MDELILRFKDYFLWKVSQENLYVMAEFVVRTNCIKYQNDIFPVDVDMDPTLEVAVDKFQSDGQEVIYDFKGETEVPNGLTK